MHVRVECYAGPRADQTPRRFELDGRVVEVEEVLDQWQGTDYRYFRLRGQDRNHYILRHDEGRGQWELTMFESPRGAAVTKQPPEQRLPGKKPGKPH